VQTRDYAIRFQVGFRGVHERGLPCDCIGLKIDARLVVLPVVVEDQERGGRVRVRIFRSTDYGE
jgi:hypothetical protein